MFGGVALCLSVVEALGFAGILWDFRGALGGEWEALVGRFSRALVTGMSGWGLGFRV